jgi:hypothetical protein
MAVAHMIEDNLCDVRTTTLADLMAYVLAKQDANERQAVEEAAYGDEKVEADPGSGFPGGHSFAYGVRRVPAPNNPPPLDTSDTR